MPIDWHHQELNKGTRLWKLHLHYFDHTELLSDEQFSLLVKDWIDQNRPYRSGYWLDSWNSYATSIRLVAWMGEYQRRCKHLNRNFLDTWVGSIQEQLEFLEENLEFDIGGNHLIKNIRALYWGSRFFFGEVGDKANSVADRLLSRELQSQILDDGFHFELSPAYHCQVFGDLLDCWRMMLDDDLKTQLETKLEIMAQVVADMTHPDGAISLFTDGGLNMAIRPSLLLDIYEQLFGTKPTARGRVHYPQAGYHVLRTNDFYFAFDAGRVGPGASRPCARRHFFL